MNREELVLGFDVRVDPVETSSAWTEQRKDTFLLRRDVVHPLSTDRLVWPSVSVPNRQPGSWNGLDLWEDWQLFREYLTDAVATCVQRPWAISITLVTGGFTDEERETWSPRLPLKTLSLPEATAFLGYDISDLSLLSALSDCGYIQPNEAQQARERWATQLNNFHLFDDVTKANEFKTFSNLRVPEHAPFYVYGLYQLGE